MLAQVARSDLGCGGELADVLERRPRGLSDMAGTSIPTSRSTNSRSRSVEGAAIGFKTPDAIHLACAMVARADVFVTGDANLARCTEIPIEIVSPTP